MDKSMNYGLDLSVENADIDLSSTEETEEDNIEWFSDAEIEKILAKYDRLV